ncbi:hypothetical protein [Skermanella pratensis]|uniref:hypothetical protein n=1 Tax=Skermanella pratensis TaxID=2233999 RepID=UPI00130184A0|nr:hypothetical protein [Skermanella pratensis]
MPDLTRDLAFDVIEAIAPEERGMLDAFYEILIGGVAGAAAGDIESPGFGQIGAGLDNDICRQVVTVSHILTRTVRTRDPQAAAALALEELWKRWCRLEDWLEDCGGSPALVRSFQEALLRRGRPRPTKRSSSRPRCACSAFRTRIWTIPTTSSRGPCGSTPRSRPAPELSDRCRHEAAPP